MIKCPTCEGSLGDWFKMDESRQGNLTRFALYSPKYPKIRFGNMLPSDETSESFMICRWGHMNPWIEPPEPPKQSPFRSFFWPEPPPIDPEPDTGPLIRVFIVGSVSGGKTQLVRLLSSGDLALPVWEASPQADMDEVTLTLLGGRAPWEPAMLDPQADTTATAAADITSLRVLQDRMSSIYGYQGAEESLARVVRTLILKEMGFTDEPDDDQLLSELDDRVASWGRTRVPYELEVQLSSHLDARRSTIRLIDTPGEIISAAMNSDAPEYAVFRDDVSQLGQASQFLAVVDPVTIKWIADLLDRECKEALQVSMRQGFDEQRRSEQSERTRKLFNQFFTAKALGDARTSPVDVVMSKCDVIHLMLSMAENSDSALGRWDEILPTHGTVRADFMGGALAVMNHYVSATSREHSIPTSPDTKELLEAFSTSSREEQQNSIAELLWIFGEPDNFWNLVDNGYPMSIDIPSLGEFDVPDCNTHWNRFLGGARLQVRDIMNGLVCGALISSGFGRNTFMQVFSQRFVSFSLTCSRQCCNSINEILPIDDPRAVPGNTNAGALQVLLRMSGKALQ